MALYTYPSNKLEYLVQVLSKLLDVEKKNLFTPTQLIVGSRGMQHWLSMQLAESRSIAMNLKYDMINGYILDICYELTSKQEHKKAYTKDVLTWRIFKSLDSVSISKLEEYYKDSDLKKYQLSIKIAETFSKYLSYRTECLKGWEKGECINQNKPEEDESWQMTLWQKLVEDVPDTPYKVQEQAIAMFSKANIQKLNIPENIYLFGINTVSPKNLDFVFRLAEYINIHILYINPCSEYWYDFHRDKVSLWLDSEDYEQQPLLANLGQQGKEFFNRLLENQEKQELEIFEDLSFKKLEKSNQCQLVSLQRNLLELNTQNHSSQKDLSISINSCHSPLREVQVLHDKLLDMVKENPDIKPRDILVMCPNIEDYSPYIDSVFSRFADDKKLPCSIADRTLLDSEPLAASFIDLLQLPESNFEVNKILDYLSVPAIQQKFNISDEQLETIHYWLKESCIHHSNDGKTFSWSWGLKRLMLGFSYSDENEIVNDEFMTVPVIEGSEVAELGGLYELLELLAEYSQELQVSRSFNEWQVYLLEMFENVFDVTNEEQYIAKKIKDIIAKTVIDAKEIVDDIKVDLYTIRYCLISQLSEPIINNHFLNGKVTFCSMTPMRNVPFKVVAMLGLNNGKFPRQENAISFDIMTRLGREKGDRTRRDDDRYLFLEAILSAREYLYISYIGRSIKTNTEQQPSLILQELINYLKANYGWQDNDIKEYPLHAFSPKCYSDNYRSYDEAWLKLLQADSQKFYDSCRSLSGVEVPIVNRSDLSTNCKQPRQLSISKLIKIFDDPIKAYANYSLELYLEDNIEELEDSEPFDIDNLEKHSLKQELFDVLKDGGDISKTRKTAKLSAKLPESVLTDDGIDSEIENIQKLLGAMNLPSYESKYFQKEILGLELEADCYIRDNQIMLYTTSSFRIKHKFELYLVALLVACEEQKDITAMYHYLDKKTDGTYKQETFEIPQVGYSNAKEKLEHYVCQAIEIVSEPKLVYLSLAEALFADGKKGKKTARQIQGAWDKVISDENNFKSLDKNEYFNLFYNKPPAVSEFEGEDVYREFFEMLNKDNKPLNN
ncbi:exodeoxyribonuclease V subunit gamma [Candidatus Francisella endociliophora]|uniref:RecBCD enzyme subunit RecC n=1 Tax=Candidatus Francisella endociliophora TaxID=653937 RepID=A0A097ER88_9GAMM|nr:exodeoxyribonuclease V subunit gamma [Francisella sp. FSC1006]AIT10057.1 exodeoxyribonuclease V subunit gamma [Francisella sp. FSC1006]